MLLIAGNDNEILDGGNASYMDGYGIDIPEELMQKIYEYEVTLKDLWIEYLEQLEKEHICSLRIWNGRMSYQMEWLYAAIA